MSPRWFLILHGVENWRPPEHWQWWLAHELRTRGDQVFYPQLPAPSSPALDEWTRVLRGELAQLGAGERTLVAHSCGVALWLLAAPELTPEERVDRVVLVAPPGRSAFTSPYRAFLPVGIDWDAVAAASAQLPLVITSDNDPYCPEGLEAYRSTYTGALDLEHELIPGAGHIAIEDGYGPWPAMLTWCLSGHAAWSAAVEDTGSISRTYVSSKEEAVVLRDLQSQEFAPWLLAKSPQSTHACSEYQTHKLRVANIGCGP